MADIALRFKRAKDISQVFSVSNFQVDRQLEEIGIALGDSKVVNVRMQFADQGADAA